MNDICFVELELRLFYWIYSILHILGYQLGYNTTFTTYYFNWIAIIKNLFFVKLNFFFNLIRRLIIFNTGFCELEQKS